jgi:exopolysaccharide biosynthesis predicted pyruvyltransferase EpsI
MAMSWYDNSHRLNTHELEYLKKVEYLWNHLSQPQRFVISSSVTSDTLRQENSKHCFIGEAASIKKRNGAPHNNSFVCKVLEFTKIIFYDGPSYDNLLDRRVTREEKKILNDIYYAKIGDREHQYRRANELVRFYIISHLSTV